jgi:hypothetical protein
VEAYGADIEPDLLVYAVRLNHDWMYAVIEEGVEEGNAEVRISATREWYAENHDRLVRALSRPGS